MPQMLFRLIQRGKEIRAKSSTEKVHDYDIGTGKDRRILFPGKCCEKYN